MNRTPSSRPSPPVGEKVPGGRLRGIPTGSWLRFTSGFWRCSLPTRCLTPLRRVDAKAERKAVERIVATQRTSNEEPKPLIDPLTTAAPAARTLQNIADCRDQP